jgi:four helix bundle protein
MDSVHQFENLDCWKAARILVKAIFQICENGAFAKDWDTRSQLKRAAVSIMNNIAEGHGRFSDADTIRFWDMAKASGNEVKSMLYLLEDVGYCTSESLSALHKLTDDAVNLTGGYLQYINNRRKK